MRARTPLAEIARAARKGDLNAINFVLDGMWDKTEEIVFGRAVADRELGRDPALPPIVEHSTLATKEGWGTHPQYCGRY